MPKHIVIDARTRPASGTGRYVDRLMEHLQKLDTENRYTILLRPGDNWQPTAKNFSVLTCKYKHFSFNPLDQITFAWFLYRLKPDFVHFALTPLEPMFYFGRRVTTTHDLTMLRFTRAGKLPQWLHEVRMAAYRLRFWWSLRLAKHVLVPTQFVKDDVTNKYPFVASKITVTHEASEPPIKGKAEKPKEVNKPFIMHVGSPFPHKNIERLIKAFELLKAEHPNLQLVLAGKKEQYFERLEQAVRQQSSASDDIIIPGFVSDAELKWLFENAEAYVLPSLSEGFGLPGLEAMAHGCPVISSNATCLPEIYGDAVIYFDPKNVDDMADKIHDVLINPSLQKTLVKNGRAQLKKYSWERMAKQTLAVYERVL